MQYSLEDLLHLMKCLRHPENGCSWDLKQTPKEIIKHSIEEIYELVEAVESDSVEEIKSELGDVLFQVVFLSRIFEEDKKFNFSDIIHTLCSKLISRHPHIFVDGDLYNQSKMPSSNTDENEVSTNWEKIKLNERIEKKLNNFFDDIPLALPALSRAYKLQKRATTVGFEFESLQNVLSKLKEEISELDLILAEENVDEQKNIKIHIEEELGDIFFSVINLARFLSADPEHVVRKANKKFIKRVNSILSILYERDNISWRSCPEKISRESLEELWIEIKQKEQDVC